MYRIANPLGTWVAYPFSPINKESRDYRPEHHFIVVTPHLAIGYSRKKGITFEDISFDNDFTYHKYKVINETNDESKQKEILKRCIERLNEKEYNLLFNNCEHFASYCFNGKSISKQVIQGGITGIAAIGCIKGGTTTYLKKKRCGGLRRAGAWFIWIVLGDMPEEEEQEEVVLSWQDYAEIVFDSLKGGVKYYGLASIAAKLYDNVMGNEECTKELELSIKRSYVGKNKRKKVNDSTKEYFNKAANNKSKEDFNVLYKWIKHVWELENGKYYYY